MPAINPVRSSEKALFLLAGTTVSVAVIGVLYVAQRVLIPVALALFFAFLLTPVVMRLQRWGANRVVAVLGVSLVSVALFLGIGWLVISQIVGLAPQLPKYTANIQKKIEAIYAIGEDPAWAPLKQMLGATGTPKSENSSDNLTKGLATPQQPVPVVVDQSEPLWLRWLPSVFGPTTEVLGQVGLVLVLMVFVLLAREDLRNRFIRLVGHGRLTVTTKAVDDASQRLSRFLLMQLSINVIFGFCMAVGLYAIGVQYALLWGFLSCVLRYVPYVGSPIATIFPVVLSIAQFETWLQPGLVVVLFLTLELLTANVFEPLLFGHSIGVSAVALLVAAAFWAFLWGPIGLVLSGPLTVCLVVLGKYVPKLGFLTVLLSDQPALEEDFTYYQRLTARDEDEATDIVLDYVKERPIDEVYDALLIPALNYASRDFQREGVDEEDIQFIREATREILVDVETERQARAPKAVTATTGRNVSKKTKVRILGVPSRSQSDEIALEMFRQLVESDQCELKIAGNDVLSSELLTMIEKHAPAAVCIAALPPGGLTRARLLCKRLRARFPDLRILVGRWGLDTAQEQNDKALRDAGANHLWTTLIASRDDVVAWLPALAEKMAETSPARETTPLPKDAAARNAFNGPAMTKQLS